MSVNVGMQFFRFILPVLFIVVAEQGQGAPLCEVGVVGTVHLKHFSELHYPIEVLERLIDSYVPEQILVEISAMELLQDDWSQTPPEMFHIAQYARQRGVLVSGFDENHQGHTTPAAIQMQLKELRQALSHVVNPMSFDSVHSAAADEALEKYVRERNSLLPADHGIRTRETFMDQEAIRLLQNTGIRKTLIFTGFTHRLHLEKTVEGVCHRLSYRK